ncbi:hypothetical protein PQY04_004078 [Salmonella enterica]|uniref:Uncharacterized protein n=1 Tax=Salmonella enterica TaxID=28901 RepID=A0A3J5R6U6_SALER|nr:hypothetical protein [Salmonella enterica]ECU4770205.1 hypothetical protein [Salmonella enterica subsp. enterica]EDQ1017792.1 hypothetical protein [Salmonella enterica subsp. houtenae serovar 50:z4,z23:-]EDV3253147.1 hypothetical protein [Salmonella enterica subsp. houtenae]EDW0441488.1 hypothetical protein [Salmonella enterica subsp. arizonae serovar 50:z4,z23:-]EEE5551570.1 hypothetical protein [Salmonella enterica subsp. enterica serovar Javiana]HAE7875247.1 hypothetical protein [Salmon
MEKTHINTENLNTIHDCLSQLVIAEETQFNIEDQLAKSNSSSEWSVWRKKAEHALKIVKGKRRIITARLAVLRQLEKDRNMQLHRQHNNFLINELRTVVPFSIFDRCVRQANDKMEKIHADQC